MKRTNRTPNLGQRFLRATVAGIIVAATPAALAATTGFNQTGAGPYDYNTAGNWVGGTINGLWNTDLTNTAAQTVTLAADTTLTTGLTFNYAGNFALTLDAAAAGTDNLTLGGDLVLNTSGGTTANVTLGDTNNHLNVDLGGVTRIINVATNRTLKFMDVVSDGGLNKTGPGTLVLTNANTYGGGTTLTAGILTIAGPGAGTANSPTSGPFGVGTLTLNAGTLNVAAGAGTIYNAISVPTGSTVAMGTTVSGATFSLAGNISGGGTINESGTQVAGTHLSGDNSGFTGVFTSANNGSHRVRFDSATAGSAGAAWTLNNAASDGHGFNFGTGTIYFGALSGGGVFRNDAASSTVTMEIGGLNTNCTFSGIINANGTSRIAVTKVGSASLTLSGANTFTNGITVNAGTLVLSNATAIGTTGSLTMNGGNLDSSLVNLINTPNNPQAWNADFTFVGSQNLNLGTGAVTPNADRMVTIASNTLAVGGPIGGGAINLTKAGNGTLALSGTNTYTGNTTLSAGKLALSGSGSLASANLSVAAGAVLDVSAQTTPVLAASQNLQGAGSVNGSLTAVATSKIFPGTDGTAGTLTFSNNLTLNASTTVQFDLSGTPAGANDKIVLAGNSAVLAPNGAVITINSAGTISTNDYVLIDLTGTGASISGSFGSTPNFAGTVPANSGNYSIVATSTQVKLHYNVSTPLSAVGAASVPTLTHSHSTLLTVTVSPAGNPASTGLAVTADLSPVNGSSSQALYDDGTHGDVTSGDHVFSLNYVIPGGTSLGSKTLNVSVTDAQSRNAVTTLGLTVTPATLTWLSAPAGANWGTAGNWDAGFAPAAYDYLFFGSSSELFPNLETAYSVDSVTFNSDAVPYTVGGGTLTLTGGGVTNNSAYPQTFNTPVAVTAAQTIDTEGSDVTLGGAVSGAGSLTKAGNYVLNLSAANSYSGGTTLNAGQLNLNASSALGTGLFTIVGGTLDNLNSDVTLAANNAQNWNGNFTYAGSAYNLNLGTGTVNVAATRTVAVNNNTLTVGGSISGAGGITASGAGTLVLSGSNTFSGVLTVNGTGTLLSGNNTNRPAASNGRTIVNSTLQLQANAGNTVGGISYALSQEPTANAPLTLNNGALLQLRADGNVTFAGANAMGGLGNVSITIDVNPLNSSNTNHTLTLAPAGFNVNSTTLNVTGGNGYKLALGSILNANSNTLSLSANTASLSLGGIAGMGPGTLMLFGGADTTLSGNLVQTSGGIEQYGNSTLTLGGSWTTTGTSDIYAGKLALGSAQPNMTGTVNIYDGAALKVIAVGTNQWLPAALTLGNGSGVTLEFAGLNNTQVAPVNPGTLTVNGTLTINISGMASTLPGTYPLVSNYTGGPVVLGTLPPYLNATLDTTGSQISLVVSSVTPYVWAAGTGNWDTNTANWKTNGLAAAYMEGAPVRLDDTASGSGPFAVTITPASVSPGGITISNSVKAYTVSGVIAGGASLTKSGNGSLTLQGVNTYGGPTTVSGGSLQVNGSAGTGATTVGANATLQLGDASANNGVVAGDITDNGSLIFADPVAQTYSGAISGSGSLTKSGNGTLTLTGATNTYTGGTTIKAGTVSIATATALGTNGEAIVLGNAALGADATLLQTGNVNVSNNLAVAAGAGARILSGNNGANGTTFSGNLAISNNLGVVKTGNGDCRFSGAFAGTGNVTLTNAGTGITYFSGPSSPNWSGAMIIAAGTVRPGGTSQWNTNTVLSIGTNNGANINFGGNNYFTVAGLNDLPGVAGGIINGGFGTPTVTLGGAGSYSFSGALISSVGYLYVAMAPGGVQTLLATNSYGGTTTISSGTLALSGLGALPATPNILLAGGAALDVSGLTSPFSLASGQTLTGSGGPGTGTLKGNVNLAAGSLVLNYTNGTPKLNVINGALNFNNNAVTVTVSGTQLPGGYFKLISVGAGGSITGTLPASVTVNGAGTTGTNNALVVTNSALYLLVTPITTIATYSTNLTATVSGGSLEITWPATHTGWYLQAQTNTLGVGLTANGWGTLSNTAAVNGYTNVIDPANGAVFFRLAKP